MVGVSSLLSQLSVTVARRIILVQLRQLVRVPLEDLFLLVWVATLVGPLGVLATPAVSLGDVVLPELANAIVLPLLRLLLMSSLVWVLLRGVAVVVHSTTLFHHAVKLRAVNVGDGGAPIAVDTTSTRGADGTGLLLVCCGGADLATGSVFNTAAGLIVHGATWLRLPSALSLAIFDRRYFV